MEAFHKKRLFWLSALFLFLPLCAMDVVKPVKNKKIKYTKTVSMPILTDCGLTQVYMPQNIARDVIMRPYFSFQDISNLKQVSKVCNTYWNAENICSSRSCIAICSAAACRRLTECHYEYRTKILFHFSKQKNSTMFAHIWAYDAETRIRELYSFVPFRRDKRLKQELRVDVLGERYRKSCCNVKMHHQRVKQFVDVLSRNYSFEYDFGWFDSSPDDDAWSASEQGIKLLKTILLGSGFNVFALSYRKKRARTDSHFGLKFMLKHVNKLKDVDLFLAMIGGKVTPCMFKKIFKYFSSDMLQALFTMKVIDKVGVDKHGRSATFYWEEKQKPPPVHRGGGIS